MSTRRRVVVHGRVQGVGFRFACARQAETRDVSGWVRNTYDGTVEAVFEGDPRAIGEMTEWCRIGPAMARVTKVEVFDEPPLGEEGFRVR